MNFLRRRHRSTNRRDPLSPAERRQLRQEIRLAQQRAMSPEEKRELMRKTIQTALNERDCVVRDDLVAANLPVDFIDLHFKALLLTVLEERKKGVFA